HAARQAREDGAGSCLRAEGHRQGGFSRRRTRRRRCLCEPGFLERSVADLPAASAGQREPRPVKPVWFILWAMAVAQIAVWTFAAPARHNEQPAPTDPGRPYNDDEPYVVESRDDQRKEAMAALDQPWSSRCGESRKRFISSVENYYYQRQNQYERYPEIHGKLGADYIAAQWLTADDKRIERLTREAYARGYLRPSDLNGVAGKLVTAVVK